MSSFLHRIPAPPGEGPLAAVKDNIDVAGMPTTAGCPSFAYTPAADAEAVRRLRSWGARIIGKTSLDQFATGLVGTRCAVPAINAFDATRIPGGSSSGSGVAVATGEVAVALGTDTAGSGRVPAALNNIVGFKPTCGWVSTTGVVPACRSLDCVSVFSRSVQEGWAALTAIAGYDASDPFSRVAPTPFLPTGALRIGVPTAEHLTGLDPAWHQAWRQTLEVLTGLGHVPVEIDFAPFAEAAASLYGGPWVAERTAAVGEFLAREPVDADPVVAGIVRGGLRHDAVAAYRAGYRLRALQRAAAQQWQRMDVLLLPTVGEHPTLAAVAADPVGVNVRLGRFTNFANLLDTCAVAVPAALIGGLPQGVTLFAPAWHDLLVARLAAALQDTLGLPVGASGQRLTGPQLIAGDDGGIAVAVFGAHLSGQPLNHHLLSLGAQLVGSICTAPAYRMVALPTTPPKPGLVRVADGGGVVTGEAWRLSPAAFGQFVAAIPAPLCIGRIALADGHELSGFLAEASACIGAQDITAFGSWPAWVARG